MAFITSIQSGDSRQGTCSPMYGIANRFMDWKLREHGDRHLQSKVEAIVSPFESECVLAVGRF